MLDNDTRQQYRIPSGDECVAFGHAMDDLLGKLAAARRRVRIRESTKVHSGTI